MMTLVFTEYDGEPNLRGNFFFFGSWGWGVRGVLGLELLSMRNRNGMEWNYMVGIV